MRRRRAVAVAAVAALAGVGGWWLLAPERLDPPGSRLSLPVAVGETASLGTGGYPTGGEVLLREVRPRVRPGSAAADVRVLWCTAPREDLPLGSVRGPAAGWCGDTAPVRGQRLAVPSADDRYGHVVLEVVLREPGTLVVDGIEVAYRDRLRRGRETTGLELTVTAR